MEFAQKHIYNLGKSGIFKRTGVLGHPRSVKYDPVLPSLQQASACRDMLGFSYFIYIKGTKQYFAINLKVILCLSLTGQLSHPANLAKVTAKSYTI